MFLVKEKQLTEIKIIYKDKFINKLYAELEQDRIISEETFITKEKLSLIVDGAIGAGITIGSLIYYYCSIILKFQVLLQKPFPVWAKNILYSNTPPEMKITALLKYLNVSHGA
jgi:hypothetical protein